MKNYLIHSFFIAFFLVLSSLAHGQIIQKAFLFDVEAPEIDTLPSFPGGDESLEKYIYTHLKEASKEVGQNQLALSTYRAVVQFQIDEKGNVIKHKIRLRESTPNFTSLDEKVNEMIKNMPSWSPCIISKKPTPQTVGLIITYNANMNQFDLK